MSLVRVAQSAVRCPWCHEDIEVSERDWVACRECLARHHEHCWAEVAVCSCCGGAETLAPRARSTAPPARRAPEPEADLSGVVMASAVGGLSLFVAVAVAVSCLTVKEENVAAMIAGAIIAALIGSCSLWWAWNANALVAEDHARRTPLDEPRRLPCLD